jgi:hypothetical protein
MLTDTDASIGDERGIVLSVNIPSVKIATGIGNSWAELLGIARGGDGDLQLEVVASDPASALVSPILTPMISAMSGLTDALSASVVSAEGVRSPEVVFIEVPASGLSDIGPSEMGLSVHGFFTVTMPLGIELEGFSSKNNRYSDTIDEVSSRQVITYEIAPGMGQDVVEFTLLLTPMWIIAQLQIYLIVGVLFVLWRARRRMTRRKRKRRAEALVALEESVASPIGYMPPQPTVEVLQVSDNGIVIKRRLVGT